METNKSFPEEIFVYFVEICRYCDHYGTHPQFSIHPSAHLSLPYYASYLPLQPCVGVCGGWGVCVCVCVLLLETGDGGSYGYVLSLQNPISPHLFSSIRPHLNLFQFLKTHFTICLKFSVTPKMWSNFHCKSLRQKISSPKPPIRLQSVFEVPIFSPSARTHSYQNEKIE